MDCKKACLLHKVELVHLVSLTLMINYQLGIAFIRIEIYFVCIQRKNDCTVNYKTNILYKYLCWESLKSKVMHLRFIFLNIFVFLKSLDKYELICQGSSDKKHFSSVFIYKYNILYVTYNNRIKLKFILILEKISQSIFVS